MFNKKQSQLIEKKVAISVKPTQNPGNLFIEEVFEATHRTTSTNGALKYTSLMDAVLVEQFASLGYYKIPRDFATIQKDALKLYGEDSLKAVKFTIFMRMITRKTKLLNGLVTTEVQRGGGLKYESIFRMIWLHTYNPEAFWKNIDLFIAAGSWKDIIQMLSYDLQFNGWKNRMLDWQKFGDLILSGLNDKNQAELIKKYLPQIKANSNCKTLESQADNIIGKWICSLLFGTKIDSAATYKQYRKLKTSGTAHQWQQLISQRKFNEIKFERIPGRALSILVRSKFLDNQALREKYEAWVTAPEVKTLKFTGFVHELFNDLPKQITGLNLAQITTINKQFDGFVALTKVENASKLNKLIVVRDTSGSMANVAQGTTMFAYDVAKALALYFSAFLENGPFADKWIEFCDNAVLHSWVGNTALERWYNDHTSFIGSTDFLSVIDLLCAIKIKLKSEDGFPKGILCISDGEFNATPDKSKTNLQEAYIKLQDAGFSAEYRSEFVIVLWDLPTGSAFGRKSKPHFEVHSAGIGGLFYFCGYEPSTIAFLTNEKVKTAKDLAEESLQQELLQLVTL